MNGPLIALVKIAAIISSGAGAMIGLEIHQLIKRGKFNSTGLFEDPVLMGVIGLFLVLTVAIFVADFTRWGVSRSLMRFLWVAAFLIGGIAFPLLV